MKDEKYQPPFFAGYLSVWGRVFQILSLRGREAPEAIFKWHPRGLLRRLRRLAMTRVYGRQVAPQLKGTLFARTLFRWYNSVVILVQTATPLGEKGL